MKGLIISILIVMSSVLTAQTAYFHAQKENDLHFIDVYESSSDKAVNPIIETIVDNRKFLIYPGLKENGKRKVLLATGLSGWVNAKQIRLLGNSETYRSINDSISNCDSIHFLNLNDIGDSASYSQHSLRMKCELLNSFKGRNYISLLVEDTAGSAIESKGGFASILLPSILEYGQPMSFYLDKNDMYLDYKVAEDDKQRKLAKLLSDENIIEGEQLNWSLISEINNLETDQEQIISEFESKGKVAYQISMVKLWSEADKSCPGAAKINILIPLMTDKEFATKVLKKHQVQYVINLNVNGVNGLEKLLIYSSK